MSFFFAAVLTLLVHSQASAQTRSIVVLPFETHAETDISYISEGFVQMLSSRLSWGNTVTVPRLTAEASALIASKQATGKNLADKIGKLMKTDYVLFGSITEFAGTYSLDTNVLHVPSGKTKAFPGLSENLDGLIPELNLTAAKINMSLFGRKTAALDLAKAKTVTPEVYSRRANPETLLPSKYWKTKKRRSKRFWEVWKTDPFDVDTRVEDDTPFWKFWESSSSGDDEVGVREKQFWEFWEDDAPGNKDMETDEFEQELEQKKKPWWKFWGPDPEDDIDDLEGSARSKPFWKFWGDDDEDVETIE